MTEQETLAHLADLFDKAIRFSNPASGDKECDFTLPAEWCDLLSKTLRAATPAQGGARWTLQESVPSDGFECYYILKDGLQIAEVSGPQNVENTANLQELVDAANASLHSPAGTDPERNVNWEEEYRAAALEAHRLRVLVEGMRAKTIDECSDALGLRREYLPTLLRQLGQHPSTDRGTAA